ncbi:hypothetical protein E9840_12740 [Tissierella creatinini]|nr:hypothetical protein E9840_12740 [Tissierella creatinini]
MKGSNNIAVLLAVLALVLIYEAQVSMAVTCNPTELSPCVNAFKTASPPSNLCCSKIKAQKPCLCTYAKNPNFSKIVASPNAKKVASTCGVQIPKC